ncbi:MAG: hypothetical protein ACK5LC_12485 [Coprobacillaceae bacterium]
MEKTKITYRFNIPVAIITAIAFAAIAVIVIKPSEMDVSNRVAINSVIRAINLGVSIIVGRYFSKQAKEARANKAK